MSYYPDLTYPTAPAFPIGHDDAPLGPDLYQVVASYIPDLTTDISLLVDRIGNIELGATEGVKWDGTIRINLAGGEIKFTAVSINIELVVNTPTLTTLNITNDLIIANDLVCNSSTFAVTGTVTQDYVIRFVHRFAQETTPGDPADDTAVFWISSGAGAYGDAGDFCCKITEGGGTTDFTITDYSAL